MYKTGLSSYLKEDVLSACFRLWNILMQWDDFTPPPPFQFLDDKLIITVVLNSIS